METKLFLSGGPEMPVGAKSLLYLEDSLREVIGKIPNPHIYTTYQQGFVEFATDIFTSMGIPVDFVVPRPKGIEWNSERVAKLKVYLKKYTYDPEFIKQKSYPIVYQAIKAKLVKQCDTVILYRDVSTVTREMTKLSKKVISLKVSYPTHAFVRTNHVSNHAPYINGHLLYHPTIDCTWHPIKEWQDTLTYFGYDKDDYGKAKYVILESIITSKTYPMDVGAFLTLIPQLSGGSLSGTWVPARQGEHYGVALQGQLP